ncbi:MAG: dTDP-4-dehydrorhamnose reductase [Pseudomonadota bacterium]
MTLLVFGKTGQVATELQRLCPDAVFLGREDADLTDAQACAARIATVAPTAIINAAAYTAVDRAEEEPELAQRVNGEAPSAMARAAERLDVPFVHISTDYVFDGSGEAPFQTDAQTGPLGAYGATKLAGEEGVRGAGGRYAILRTSWVFSAHGNNFLKTMLRLSETRDRLTIVADQIGGPTPAAAIAKACLAMAEALRADPSKAGAYHFSGAPDVSWADFARGIFQAAGRIVDVVDIPSSDYPTPAKRPLNSRLDCSLTEQVFGVQRPDWSEGVADVLKDMKA